LIFLRSFLKRLIMQHFLLIPINRKSIFYILIFILFIPFFLYSQPATTPQIVTVTYSNANSYSFTVPNTAYNVTGTAIGGGGGGGGAKVKGYRYSSATGVAAAAAGGGGSGCRSTAGLSAGNNYDIVVGRGGMGGNLSQMSSCPGDGGGFDRLTAGAGGTSSIGSVVSADGGSPAYDTYTYSSGLLDQGGRVTNGGSGCSSTGVDGNPGSMTSAAWNYTAPTNVRGGKGGNNSSENGGYMEGGSGGSAGQTGTVSGAGGGGAVARESGTSDCQQALGGAGANGQVSITFTLPVPVLNITSSSVCMGDIIHFYINNPETAQNCSYTLYRNGTAIGTLETSNSFHYAVNSAFYPSDTATYYVVAHYNISASGATVSGITSIQSVDYSVTVKPKQVISEDLRWSFDHVCPIDESFEDDSASGYYANNIQWDSIVQGYTNINQLIWYEDTACTVILKENGTLTTAGLALQAQNKFKDFDQSLPHAEETYWVCIAADSTHCQSDPKRVTVMITENDIELPDVCIALYTKQTADEMEWLELIEGNPDISMDNTYQGIWWFANETEANTAYSNQDDSENMGAPSAFSLNTPMSTTSYWAIRYDDVGGQVECLTKPFKVTATVFSHPEATIRAANGELKDTLCTGDEVVLTFHFTAGTPPYYMTGSSGITYRIPADSIDGNGYFYLRLENQYSDFYKIVELTDTNRFLYSCFYYEHDFTFYEQVTITYYSAPSNISNVTTPAPLCEGNELQLSNSPTFNSNSETYYTANWKLDGDELTIPYYVTVADKGKALRYFVSNLCGTDSSNEVILMVCDGPDFSLDGISAVCEGVNLNEVLNLPTVDDCDFSISSWSWILDGTTLSSSTGGGGGTGSVNCEVGTYKVYNTETGNPSYPGPAVDISDLNITVSDFNNSYFTGTINSSNDCDQSIITLVNSSTVSFTGGIVCSPSVSEVKWYDVSSVTSTIEFPVNSSYGTYIFPLGFNACRDMGTPPNVNILPTNTFNQAGWVYADNTGKLTKIAYCGDQSVSYLDATYHDLVLVDPLCSSGGSGTGDADPLELPDYTITFGDNGKELILIVETECGITKDTITLEIYPLPVVSINDNTVCESETIRFTFTGTPPFTLDYTVDKQGVGTGLTPTNYGFPTQFFNGASGVDNWTSSGNNTYTCTVTPNSPGEYTLNIIKIADGNTCENSN
jgi:hypothetical protein